MRLAWIQSLRGRFWRMLVLLLCLATPDFFTVEILELSGTNDNDSEAEALISDRQTFALGTKEDNRKLGPPFILDALFNGDPLSGIYCNVTRWASAAKLRLFRGARAAVLRAIASTHPQAPLTAFATPDSPSTDPA